MKFKHIFNLALGSIACSCVAFTFASHTVAAETGSSSTSSTLTLKKVMKHTEGYMPKSTDAFTIKFEQIDNDVKYWGTAYGNADAAASGNIAPKVEAAISQVSIAGTGARETIDKEEKTASGEVNLATSITKPGIYTYRVTEQTPATDWTSSAESYILKVKLAEKENVKTYTVTVLKEKKDGSLESDKVVGENTTGGTLTFTNTLDNTHTGRQHTVYLNHAIGGDTSLVPTDRTYNVKVTITKRDGTILDDYNAKKITFNRTENKSIPNVPVGAKVKIEEVDADNKGLLGNDKTTIKRDTTISNLTDPTATSQTGGGTIADSFLVVEIENQTDNQNNSFTVTDIYKNIVNTGLELMTSPFVVLIAVALCGVGTYTIARRKVRNH